MALTRAQAQIVFLLSTLSEDNFAKNRDEIRSVSLTDLRSHRRLGNLSLTDRRVAPFSLGLVRYSSSTSMAQHLSNTLFVALFSPHPPFSLPMRPHPRPRRRQTSLRRNPLSCSACSPPRCSVWLGIQGWQSDSGKP